MCVFFTDSFDVLASCVDYGNTRIPHQIEIDTQEKLTKLLTFVEERGTINHLLVLLKGQEVSVNDGPRV